MVGATIDAAPSSSLAFASRSHSRFVLKIPDFVVPQFPGSFGFAGVTYMRLFTASAGHPPALFEHRARIWTSVSPIFSVVVGQTQLTILPVLVLTSFIILASTESLSFGLAPALART